MREKKKKREINKERERERKWWDVRQVRKKAENRLDTIFVGSLTSDGVMKCILQDRVRKRLTLLCKTHKNRCYYRYKNHTKSVFFYILPSVLFLLENRVEVVQYNLPLHPSSSTVHHSPYAIFHPFHPVRKQNIFYSVFMPNWLSNQMDTHKGHNHSHPSFPTSIANCLS